MYPPPFTLFDVIAARTCVAIWSVTVCPAHNRSTGPISPLPSQVHFGQHLDGNRIESVGTGAAPAGAPQTGATTLVIAG